MAGYSGKPLSAKLGIAEGDEVAVLHAPEGFEGALAPLPPNVTVGESPSGRARVVLLFSRRAAELERELGEATERLPAGGMLWIAWPKKASRQPTDLTEDVVRRIGLATGMVDVKVCAVDETWSGLKFVRRRVASAGARAAGR